MFNLEFSIIFIFIQKYILFIFQYLTLKKKESHWTKLVILGINKFNLIIKI
jgi:hypothetical protein